MSAPAKQKLMFSNPKKIQSTSQKKHIPIIDKDLTGTPDDTEICISDNESVIITCYKNENKKLREELEKMKAILCARDAKDRKSNLQNAPNKEPHN